MTLRMLDSITPANLPPGADAYLGYVDGSWPDFQAEVQRFPGAHILGLAVTAADDAEGLDVEFRDATPDQAPMWVQRQLARGVRRPVVYCSASVSGVVLAMLARAGVARAGVRLLSAHYTYAAHICGPSSCGYPAADGTQWRNNAPGLNGSLIDESALLDSFSGSPPSPDWTQTMIANLPMLQLGAADQTADRMVHRVQGLCVALGAGPLVIDGAFGAATQAAVKRVQAQFGITQDGIVGPATWGCLVAGQPA